MRPIKVPIGSLELQERDLELFRGLFESRLMTIGHIASLHFEGRKEAAQKRLQKLKAARFIDERTRRVNEPAVLFLTSKAFALLREHGILHGYPSFSLPALARRAEVSDLTLRHELSVMDVKAAFHSAIRKTKNLSIAEFGTWPLLNQFEVTRDGARVPVKPDGFIRIHEKEPNDGLSEHAFFLEVDRSSESLNTLVEKAVSYLHHYKSGGFAVRNGGNRDAFKKYPFQVLMVFKKDAVERKNNVAELLLRNTPPIFTQVCLSTLDEVMADPFGSVWVTPKNYREAVKGTQFDTERERETRGYRRQTERDMFVEKTVEKFSLLA